MANEFPNAVILMESDAFRKWCRVAVTYQARKVVAAGGAESPSLRLAKQALASPDVVTNHVVNAFAGDAEIAAKGTTPEEIGQATFVAKIDALWPYLAAILSP